MYLGDLREATVEHLQTIHEILLYKFGKTAYVPTVYLSIHHNVELKAQKEVLGKRKQKRIPTAELIKMIKLILESNFLKFSGQIKFKSQEQLQEINMYQHMGVCLWIKLRNNFQSIRNANLLPGFNISTMLSLFGLFVFFSLYYGEEKFKIFLENHNRFHPNIKFTHESSKESIPFIDVYFNLSRGKLKIDLHIKPTERHLYV